MSNNDEIRFAIDSLDLELARRLLRDALRDSPTADIYYLASLVAITDSQKEAFLNKCIELDPFFPEAHKDLDVLKNSRAERILDNSNSESQFVPADEVILPSLTETARQTKKSDTLRVGIDITALIKVGGVFGIGDGLIQLLTLETNPSSGFFSAWNLFYYGLAGVAYCYFSKQNKYVLEFGTSTAGGGCAGLLASIPAGIILLIWVTINLGPAAFGVNFLQLVESRLFWVVYAMIGSLIYTAIMKRD